MAWILVRKDFPGKKILDILIDLPLSIPTAVIGVSVTLFWIRSDLFLCNDSILDLISSPFIMLIALHVVFTYSYMVRSMSAVLEQIDKEYEIAAMTLGASKWTAIRTITLPLFRSGLAMGIILCFSRSLSETGGTAISMMMFGHLHFYTGPTLIKFLIDGQLTPEVTRELVLLGSIMMTIALSMVVITNIVVAKFKIPIKKVWPELGRRISCSSLTKVKDISSTVFFLFVVIIPTLCIVLFIGGSSGEGLEIIEFFTSIGISIFIAGIAVIFGLIFGIPLAVYIARNKNNRIGCIVDTLTTIPLVIPTSALGFSLALFWGSSPSFSTRAFLAVILGHISFTYPLIVRNISAAVEKVDRSYEDVAMTLGAKPFQAFRKILFPMIKPSIIAGSILAFTRSFGETGATYSICRSVLTVPIFIVNLIGGGFRSEAAICSIAIILICLLMLSVFRIIIYLGSKNNA